MFAIPNINLPLYVFLFVFMAYMLFYVLYSLFNVYHLIRYGVYGFGLYLIVTIFAGGTIILLAGSTFMLMTYDWTLPISLNNAAKFYTEDLFPDL
ncbi:hypothetical protein HY626_03545 [Candidatus Uhrbacteria bacterium]|nr:hypothetical protein [Candidatus Uhrbacteria bacterium]